MPVGDVPRGAEDLEVLPMWGAYDTAMSEYCSRNPHTEECEQWVFCKRYPEAWVCETSVLRQALAGLVETATYHLWKTVADTAFWVARRLRR